MDTELLQKFEEQNRKLDAIYASTEKTRRYFLWMLVGNAIVFFLPLIGFIAIIPWLLSSFSSVYSELL